MKNTLFLVLLLILAFAGFSFISSTLKRSAFVREADSLMHMAKDLTPDTAPGLLINKAEQYAIHLVEDDILFESERADVDTKTSVKLEHSGLKTTTYTATLDFTYSQSVLGFTRHFSYSRTSNFTRAADLPPRVPEDFDPFGEGP